MSQSESDSKESTYVTRQEFQEVKEAFAEEFHEVKEALFKLSKEIQILSPTLTAEISKETFTSAGKRLLADTSGQTQTQAQSRKKTKKAVEGK